MHGARRRLRRQAVHAQERCWEGHRRRAAEVRLCPVAALRLWQRCCTVSSRKNCTGSEYTPDPGQRRSGISLGPRPSSFGVRLGLPGQTPPAAPAPAPPPHCQLFVASRPAQTRSRSLQAVWPRRSRAAGPGRGWGNVSGPDRGASSTRAGERDACCRNTVQFDPARGV